MNASISKSEEKKAAKAATVEAKDTETKEGGDK